MKKTIITLLALAGIASAVEVTTNLMPTDYTWKTYTATEPAWPSLGWYQLTEDNIETSLGLLGATETGSYAFNHTGTDQASTGQVAISDSGDLVLTGRNGLAAVQTLFAQIVSVDSLLGGYSISNLGALTLNVDYTTTSGSDGWVGLYVLDNSNQLTTIQQVNVENEACDLRTGDSTSISMTTTQISNLDTSDKLVILFREGSAGKTTTITGLSATVNIPEPTTATLSLLALAGLAARRRRK